MIYFLQRYIASKFLLVIMLGTTFFILFLLSFQMTKFFSIIFSGPNSFSDIALMFFQSGINLLPLALPFAFFFSTIFSVNKLSESSELTIMKASGLSYFQLYLPYLLISLISAYALYGISSTLAPRNEYSFKEKIHYLRNQLFLSKIKSKEFLTEISGITFFAEDVSPDHELKNVFIEENQNENDEKTIFASRGKIHLTKDQDKIIGVDIELLDGNIFVRGKNNINEKLLFKKYIFPISLVQSGEFRAKAQNEEGSILVKNINSYPKENKEKDTTFYKMVSEYHSRINTSLLLIMFTLLGFTLGEKNQRSKNKNGIKIFLFLVSYYGLSFGLLSLAHSGNYYIPLIIYGPTLLFFIIGLYRLSQMKWLH